jgi:hypothetical protein
MSAIGLNAQKPDIPIERGVNQFDLSRNISGAGSLECVVCLWGGSAWIADMGARPPFPSLSSSAPCRLLPRTHTFQVWTVRRAEGRGRTHRDIGSKVGGQAANNRLNHAVPSDQRRPCPRLSPNEVDPQASFTGFRNGNPTEPVRRPATLRKPIAHSGARSFDAIPTGGRF